MIIVNIHEAKTNLSKLIAKVEETGETIRICRNGKAVVEVSPIKPKRSRLEMNPRLKVVFHENPMTPLDPEDWGDLY